MMADRHGAHTPAVVNVLLKRIPSAAKLSMLGVIASLSPKQPMFGLMSSHEIQTMFGRSAADFANGSSAGNETISDNSSNTAIQLFNIFVPSQQESNSNQPSISQPRTTIILTFLLDTTDKYKELMMARLFIGRLDPDLNSIGRALRR